LPPGSRVEVRRGSLPVLLARVHGPEPDADGTPPVGAPFTDRLVAKFALPVEGWRGRKETVLARGDDPPQPPRRKEAGSGHA